jgi:hypothetical protein
MAKHRIYTMVFANVHIALVAKALEAQLKKAVDVETFFANAPVPNPSRALIKGVVCSVRVEEVEEPTMREI